VDEELRALAAKQAGKKPITCRPVEAPGGPLKHMDDLRKELKEKGLPDDDEHCVIYAMFPPQLIKHLEGKSKKTAPVPVAEKPAAVAAPSVADKDTRSQSGPGRRYGLTVNGQQYEVGVEELS
jgi:pyruvate/oxaloacetate carboxyltransferase